MNRKRIVVVGGGVAGLEIATQLGRKLGRAGRAEVTLLDRDSVHVWKPMLHTIAAGISDMHREQLPFVAQAAAQGFTYQPGEMGGLDRDRRVVQVNPLEFPDGRVLLGARELPYDILILALGSSANDFGTPGVAEHCHFIDSRVQSDNFNREARAQILKALARDTKLSIAIVGGGATGVELAAALVQLTDAAAAYGIKDLPSRIGLSLLEAGPRLLPVFPERVSAAVQEQLQSLGVDVRTDCKVSAAEPEGYRLADGQLLEATLKVWAAGVKAPAFLSDLPGLETTSNHQLIVRPSLQTTHDECVFAVGDCASLIPAGQDRPLPPTAQVAHQQAQHLVRYLPAWLDGTELPAFAYRDFGALVSLGRYNAFGTLGRYGFFRGGFIRGRFAQLSHMMLYRSHQVRLHGLGKGTLIWLADQLNAAIQPRIRLD